MSALTLKPLVINSGHQQVLPEGDTLLTPQSTTANASLNLPEGTAPTSPNNGDVWTTASGMYVQIAGSTVGPLGTGGGGGTVTTTGTPASGNLTKFSGATSITNGDLSGDVTTSGTLATTIASNAVTTAKIAASAVTLAKIQNATANSVLLGSGAAGSGAAYVEITLGTNLSMSGTTLNAAGGSGSPGGSSGQIQYNNAGSFGGFTVSGDGTLNTGTGALTVTKTNGVAFAASATTDTTNASNISSGTLASARLPTINGRLLNIQYFTSGSGATYTPTSGTNSVVVELVGGGAGGSGAPASGAGQAGMGPGGQGGGWLRVRLTSAFSGATYTVGAKGSGGTAGATNGNDGGDTTFTTTTPTTYTAKGGKAQGAGTGPFATPWARSQGVTPNTTTGGDIAISGNLPGPGLALAHFNVCTAPGGTSVYSLGSPSVNTGGVAPPTPSGYGGGGGGGASDAGSAVAGADGSAGLIIIYEYS